MNGLGTRIGDRECSFLNAGSCVVHDLINFNTGLELSLLLIANAVVQLGGTSVGAGPSASAFADFLDTSFISGLTFTDVNGNPLELSFTADSGLTYLMPQPPNGAPEPATLALLGVGLAALAARRAQSTQAGHSNCPEAVVQRVSDK